MRRSRRGYLDRHGPLLAASRSASRLWPGRATANRPRRNHMPRGGDIRRGRPIRLRIYRRRARPHPAAGELRLRGRSTGL